MNKCFILTQFGEPHEWTQQYINHVEHLGDYGWYWKIFTPNAFISTSNVEIVPMTAEQFNDLVEEKTGVRSKLAVSPLGVPNIHVSDFYIYAGKIFEDHLTEMDFWGITNFDMVYGRLDRFLSDLYLENCDVFTNDVNAINGIFSLFRNTKKINELYEKIPNWKEILSQPPCPGCVTKGAQHRLYGSDELLLTDVMKTLSKQMIIRYGYPTHYPALSHDRLEQHVPKIKLQHKDDGSLWELFRDTIEDMDYVHHRPYIGNEIYMFHFSKTKRWPL